MTTASAAAPSRRALAYTSLEDILADIETLTAGPVRSVGNWSAAENVDHVRRLMRYSREGGSVRLPLPMRLMGRLLKRSVLTKPIKPGFKVPAGAADAFSPDPNITLPDAVAALREEIALASAPGAMCHPSPLVGPLTHDEWTQVHCRHAELHFSHLVPDDAGA